ncbi:MAG: response regulator, partial [Sphingomonadales bacterium]|nr:response regulator [Sphingomonadales bacterium]
MVLKAVVVDDDASSAAAVGRLLEQAGCRVVATCTDPDQALAAALDTGVDLVSLDIKMPRLSGFDVLSLIRSHEHSRRAASVPVIAVTGDVSDEARADCLAIGFAAHVAKPVRLDDLRRVVERAAALHRDRYRARYSVDQDLILERLDHLSAGGSAEASASVAGLALVLEQQGAAQLRQTLLCAYQGQAGAAAERAARLVEVGDAIGARHLASLCRELEQSTGSADAARGAVQCRDETTMPATISAKATAW